MSYEIKNEISSCHVSMDFLKDIEKYLREQADNLSVEEKKYIENSINYKEKNYILQ